MLCAYMPDSIADKCEDYVQQYGDEIIRLIMEMEMDPDEICAELGLCSTMQMPTSNILYGKNISSKKKTQSLLGMSYHSYKLLYSILLIILLF